MLPMYYTSEYVAEMLTKPPKVCALCDAGFPKTHYGKVISVDGTPVKLPTIAVISDKTYNKIIDAINK